MNKDGRLKSYGSPFHNLQFYYHVTLFIIIISDLDIREDIYLKKTYNDKHKFIKTSFLIRKRLCRNKFKRSETNIRIRSATQKYETVAANLCLCFSTVGLK